MPASSLPAPVPDLISRLKADRESIFAKGEKEIFFGRAPGRIDVMGGIADYTGGLVCEMPLDSGAAVAVQRRDDRKLLIKTYNAGDPNSGRDPLIEMSLDDFYGTAALLPNETLQSLFAGSRHWAAYVAGSFPELAKHKKLRRQVTGANMAVLSDVPLGAGVASSAALTCATLWALTAAYHLILDPLETAILAQKVENHIVGAPCGVMDQVTSMLGKKDQLLLLDCRPHEIRGYLPIPKSLQVIGIYTGVTRATVGPAYRATRVSAFMAHAIILQMLGDLGIKKDPTDGYLARIDPALYSKYFRAVLPETITGKSFLDQYAGTHDRATRVDPAATYYPRAAADHHVNENLRSEKFIRLLKEKNAAEAAGPLMFESHRSMTDLARLGCPEADVLVDMVRERGPKNGFYGARIAGGGGGGTVAILMDKSDSSSHAIEEIVAEYQKRTGRAAAVFAGSGPGAAEVGVAKIKLGE